eukprot:Lithocolla_globosa_v1_NODE_2660_length_1916_cov_15.614186.p1 type:complete len:228 gc:universal NODE_2660_length_1916_cov_15.614186:769-86(-)
MTSKKRPFLKNTIEYDLSSLKDSRAGFFFEEESEKRPRKKQRQIVSVQPPIHSGSLCEGCQSPDVSADYLRWFGVLVCNTCKKDEEGAYRLMTKGQAMQEYILTSSELATLPHVSRPNPRNPNWSDMKLHLTIQVERYAKEKWGSLENLDQEYEKRQQKEKVKRRGTTFDAQIKELKKQTVRDHKVTAQLVKQFHEHTFGEPEKLKGEDMFKKTCTDCGFEVEFEQL